MIHAMLEGLAAAERHCCGRLHSKGMGCAVHRKPVFGFAACAGAVVLHGIIENPRVITGD
jgi:hypothetical protein